MNSTKFIIVAIALVIGLALTPVVAQQTGVLTNEPGCPTGNTPKRATAVGSGLAGVVVGNVFCDATGTTTVPASGDSFPTTPGGRFNSLYAGPASDRTTAAPVGTLLGAGSIISLVPLIYIVGILLVPVAMLGKKFMKM